MDTSWRVRVQHHTGYRYQAPVTDSYNEARLTPRSSPHQTVLESRVDVEPAAHLSRFRDYWGTTVHAFDLHKAHDELAVIGTTVVETRPPATGPAIDTLSWEDLLAPDVQDQYCEYLAPSKLVPSDPQLAEIAADIAAAAPTPSAAIEAASALVRERLTYERGSTTVSSSAVDAWNAGSGVCQDFVHLTLALLRSMGIPGRYVSGYLHPSKDAQIGEECVGESHAWVNVWLGGWEPLDPTNGNPVGVRHVVVAKGRDYADVTPLRGIYSGEPGAESTVKVVVTRLA